MIFKLSNIHRVFFTYFCPTFYGSPPAAPSNTTSTQTINQSPWQNPIYQSLMLGTKEAPGPVTSMLKSSAEQTAQWNAINKAGLPPATQASLGTWNPNAAGSTSTYVDKLNAQTGQYTPTLNSKATANRKLQAKAEGGLATLRGYKTGTKVTKSTGNVIQDAAVEALGRQLTPAEYTNLTTTTPAGGSKAAALKVFKALPEGVKYAKTQATAALAKTPAGIKAAKLQKAVDAGKTISAADNTFLSNYRTNESKIGTSGFTIDPITGKVAPPKYPQGATAAEKAAINKEYTKVTGNTVTASGAVGPKKAAPTAPYALTDTLKKVAYFDPVTGKSTNADFLALQQKARKLGTPEQFAKGTAAYDEALTATKALQNYKPTDVSASKADVVNAEVTNAEAAAYEAERMSAPTDIAAQDYEAAQAQGAQMAGPSSWIQAGTAEQYMNPYMQNVVDIQKREANRDYEKQLNALNSQAVQAGAFGGSRQAIERSEAARNQATKLSDIEAQGLNQAYTSGMGQFTTEQGQQLQAGQANLSAEQQTQLANQNATNAQRQQYVQAQLDAAKNNYGGQLTAAQQNQVAANAASQFNAANIQQVNLANAAAANTASQFNAGAANTANLTYAQQQLAASQGNQQAGLTANQQNLGAANQLGTIGQGLGSLGTAQNATQIANLGAQGQVAQAEQNLGQSYADTQTANAQNWLNAPTTINAGVLNAGNAQPVSGGTSSVIGTTPKKRGGLIRYKGKK
jgi:hypothetical protein